MILSTILSAAFSLTPAPPTSPAVSPAVSPSGAPAAVARDGEAPTLPAEAKAEAERRSVALKALQSPLPEGLSDEDQVRALARRAIAATVALGKDSETSRRLLEASRNAMESVNANPKAAALLIDLVTDAAKRDLAFQPTMEAPLPKGFPWPVPAGEIRVQTYPGYRKVVTDMQGNAQNGAFFKLFRHITSNDIAMTAPVEMTMGDSQDEMLDMAFLYGDPEIGEAGDAGRVEVTDIEPMKVVSIGIRGTLRSFQESGAMEALNAWLERNDGEWERAGNARLMGYNGPMVPRNQQFCEIQIPVRKRAKD
ncbi:SOUL heme-binding protein [Planctomycetes bacterium Poly30]|uniref:SOUL heme-binding protein n=1 Tax=Saltatorellus ferox TaxID=2528018 RepID=A0A518EY26_9BACT|nr:SOUL heme-binding protein [Planctomycetes bacterium Poly30]